MFFRVFLVLNLLGGGMGVAQETKGGEWQERSGFALVKPQPWSQDNQASIIEFLAFADRSVKGSKAAGYFVLRTAKTPEMQVPSARVVKLVVYPEPPRDLVRAEHRAALQKIIDEYAAISAKFSSVSPVLEKRLAVLNADAAKFDAGNIKEAGRWAAKSAAYKKKADELASLAQVEMTSAPKVKAYNLSESQYYIGLQQMAAAEPAVKAQLESVRSLYESLCRKEERNELVGKLKAPDVTSENAELYIKTLKSLKPEEDSVLNQFLESWGRSEELAAKLRARIAAQQAAFGKEMAAKTDATQPVVVSADLAARVSQTLEELKGVPQAIPLPVAQAKAMAACASSLQDIQKDMETHRYFDAKGKIVDILKLATLVGSSTAAAVDLLQKKTTAEIEKFESLRDEAKGLQAGGKAKEALIKYNEALAIMPDKDVTAQVASLKK